MTVQSQSKQGECARVVHTPTGQTGRLSAGMDGFRNAVPVLWDDGWQGYVDKDELELAAKQGEGCA